MQLLRKLADGGSSLGYWWVARAIRSATRSASSASHTRGSAQSQQHPGMALGLAPSASPTTTTCVSSTSAMSMSAAPMPRRLPPFSVRCEAAPAPAPPSSEPPPMGTGQGQQFRSRDEAVPLLVSSFSERLLSPARRRPLMEAVEASCPMQHASAESRTGAWRLKRPCPRDRPTTTIMNSSASYVIATSISMYPKNTCVA
mmetsp:Transcript_6188/g.12589  ORF Transcript_6188/g.12589 Transcript_6188/m.12589 type:complete len:200 (+) Transcript_6188:430-1029(+)